MIEETGTNSALQAMTGEAYLALADSLVIDENLNEAMDAYAAAVSLLSEDSKNSNLYFRACSHMSQSKYNLGRYEEALEDAEKALEILSETRPELRSGESEVVHKRAGAAAFELKNYSKAYEYFGRALQLAELNKRSTSVYLPFLKQCQSYLNPSEDETPIIEDIPTKSAGSDGTLNQEVTKPIASTTTKSLPQMPKYQYYQSDTVMTISILEAKVKEEDLRVTFEPQRLTVQLRKGGVNFTVIAGTLYSPVVVDRCKIVYKDEKVLIKLRKKDTFEWHELFGKAVLDDSKPTDEKAAEKEIEAPKPVPVVKDPTKVRPYSSHRDWDAIEKDLKEEEKKEKPVGDEAMNKLFQQIYANADEDTRRAMVKSYQTSGGTVLSTNWQEVARKDYEKERTAPKGLEWKNWEGEKLPMKDDD